MGSVIRQFILTKAKNASFGSYMAFVGTFVTLVMAFEYIYTKYFIGQHGREALAWAVVTSGSISVLGFLAISCTLSQLRLTEELDRVAEVKKNLENKILRNRKSSKPFK